MGGAPVLRLKRPSVEQFRQELVHTIADAELREDRTSEILMQTQDIRPFLMTMLPGRAEAHPTTWQVLGIAQQLALHVEMRFKHEFACARPFEYSPQVQPMIRTPGHGSYPMGHGCEAYLMAEVLGEVVRMRPDRPAQKSLRNQLKAAAIRIGENRIIAGVHFQTDMHAGIALGAWLAKYFLWCASADFPSPVNSAPDGSRWYHEFDPATAQFASYEEGNGVALVEEGPTAAPSAAMPSNAALRALWQQARQEWAWRAA
jgi:hypothetical protein